MSAGLASASEGRKLDLSLFYLTVENIQFTPPLRTINQIATDPASTTAPVRAIPPKITAIANGGGSTF
jgi:hypothetical protein